MSNSDLHVVLGAGPAGSIIVDELVARGLRVRHVNRSPIPNAPAGVETHIADVSSAEQAIEATAGAATIYHAIFVSATDPVWLATLDAIRVQPADDGLIYRYRNADGLEGGEGAFTTCTFLYIECLARAGRLDEARLAMAKGLRYANRLGLFSEEMSRLAEPLGNFPQALTHLAFISAAYFLDRRLSHPKGGIWQL